MDTFFGRTRFRKLFTGALALALLAPTSGLRAGTRMIPPPPPRHQNDTTIDGIQQDSEWGTFPGQDKWEALRDDEGEQSISTAALSTVVPRVTARPPASK